GGTDGPVSALTLNGGTLYAGGLFRSATGLGVSSPRRNLAAFDSLGAVSPWNPGTNGAVNALASSPGTLYAGGAFTSAGGAPRNRLAAFDLAVSPGDGVAADWHPAADGTVLGMTYSAERGVVYAVGQFKSLNGVAAHGYAAALDALTGKADPDFVSPGYRVYAVAADAAGTYAGAGGSGGHLWVWNPDGSVRHDYQTDGGVEGIAVMNGEIYAGGHFTNYCLNDAGHKTTKFICDRPLLRRKLFSIRLPADGANPDWNATVTDWNPAANSAQGVDAVATDATNNAVVVGGEFTTINGKAQRYFAEFATGR
ncbi:MAG TPA: hypothetical protein VM347_02010, partial [Nonomuraea sp.]|nr:hypothetical protein [Nonomuraea sp.]